MDKLLELIFIATNIFERDEQLNQWLLVHHHGNKIHLVIVLILWSAGLGDEVAY